AGVNTSLDACSEVYCGKLGAFSEPECRNVRALLDKGATFYTDVHSDGQDVLYSWGIETNGTDPNQNFLNPAFDRHAAPGFAGRDGVGKNAYSEFIDDADHKKAKALAGSMGTATGQATGSAYTAKPSADLYVTSGAADDYAYSRHIVDPTKPNTISYTI